jgi:hypothetical protein
VLGVLCCVCCVCCVVCVVCVVLCVLCVLYVSCMSCVLCCMCCACYTCHSCRACHTCCACCTCRVCCASCIFKGNILFLFAHRATRMLRVFSDELAAELAEQFAVYDQRAAEQRAGRILQELKNSQTRRTRTTRRNARMDSAGNISIATSALSKKSHTEGLGQSHYCQAHASIVAKNAMYINDGQLRSSGVFMHKSTNKEDIKETLQEGKESIPAIGRQTGIQSKSKNHFSRNFCSVSANSLFVSFV